MAGQSGTARGLVHIYCGDGKGKTTAAAGLALRAAAAGLRVLILQFFKDGTSGEMRLLAERPEVTVLAGGTGKFFWEMDSDEREEQTRKHNDLLDQAKEIMHSGRCDVLILDELLSAWNTGLIEREKVLSLIDGRPSKVELVLTGRDPAPELLERGDYISEVVARRHPFEQGFQAREGIEY